MCIKFSKLKTLVWAPKILSKTMAVVVRCSCVLTRLNSDDVSRKFRPHDHTPGKFAPRPPKVEKLKSSFEDTSSPSTLHHFSSHKICTWPSLNSMLRQQLFAQQEVLRFKVPAIALFVANALMFIAPLEALAETCETNNSDLNMPLLLLLSLIGATVGGLLARQRRGETEKLNEQLRQINAALRRQAKIESYAPTLSYAPVGGKMPEEVIIDPKNHELISHLKTGKIYLRNQNPDKAFIEFKTALELAQNMKDPIREKKAARGLGASLQRQGKYKEAIKYHLMVLDISEREGETSGNTEAYGAIADCYTELGDLDQAGKFYDKYIERLETD